MRLEGPPRYFVPIVRHPADFPLECVGGPIGYVEKPEDAIGECPIHATRYQEERVMTEEEIQKHLETISGMTQEEMASLWRHAPSGHPYFDRRLPLFAAFEKRFKELGGMTPAISKAIG